MNEVYVPSGKRRENGHAFSAVEIENTSKRERRGDSPVGEWRSDAHTVQYTKRDEIKSVVMMSSQK